MRLRILALALASCLLVTAGCSMKEELFSHSIQTTKKKPWTHLEFRNNSDHFQFAVVSDNTGGARPGIFESSVYKLNSIQPEFVLSVGDYIEGYTTDTETITNEWTEFEGWSSKFEMPFFYLPGNHDISNPHMGDVWEKRFGKRYYSFVYKDVLFICLDTQDKATAINKDVIQEAGLTKEQVLWAKQTLKNHSDVKWTFIIMHQPLWLYEEESAQENSRHKIHGKKTGFSEIEATMGSRKYTVLAGHFHRYTRYVRNKSNYIVLSTTGGASKLRGTAYGEFDHAAWITMTPKGPKIANLLLDGIQPDDVYTEKIGSFVSSVKIDYKLHTTEPYVLTGSLDLYNPFDHVLVITEEWDYPTGSKWKITSDLGAVELKSGEKKTFSFHLAYDPGDSIRTIPAGRLNFVAGSEYQGSIDLESPGRVFASINLPTATANSVTTPPQIDGILDDVTWSGAATIPFFTNIDYSRQSPDPSKIYIKKDDKYIYIAGEFTQETSSLVTLSKQPGDPLWTDDSIELFFDASLDKKTYQQALVTASNIMNQIRIDNIESATGRTENGWTIEMRIPVAELKVSEEPLRQFGFNIRRNRIKEGTIHQSEWSASFSSYPHNVDLFGIVMLKN